MLTTDFPTGSPCWIDLGTPNIPATAEFYGKVFGWTFQEVPEAGGYGFLQLNGKTVGALGNLDAGAHSAWTTYFLTTDAEATVKAVEQAGGTVRVPPMDVMQEGRFAALTDPQGAEFAIWQAGGTKGLDVASVDDALCWAELHTPDPEAAFPFYKGLFGWRMELFEPSPGMSYRVISTADGDQQATSFGGIAPTMQEEQRAAWTPYFASADVDATVAKATAAGGSVMMPASDVENVGRIAWLADPHGAPFALIKGEPRQ
ncbi:VOC family protein [Streptomyces rubellomurinus]|uniref:Hydroxylase n=2 Tax=Streptomyces TaxID=1883 RepID=A0A0F2TK82_STRR3|nr:VOC family protein [Streptomyces rubellomurinus]KJS54474.1 hydroxylase [Streptomyces rubellomurinus subsp. indigoferus]KJS63544.1 hydroxylase [Streptomyces rubellomurinus]